ncbi:hypothetical protein PS806_004758 [Escherichia coli]|nr:hypothetical protein [Escherichia coli]EEU3357097.1 hypothetical protein [Escherichia coli]EFB2184877.1 hypothetical protein [Escherichia coli]EFE9288076.1 hypothetical protein [Escherichia coli]EGT7915939.1 hypothetical protein [Escherichia coli]
MLGYIPASFLSQGLLKESLIMAGYESPVLSWSVDEIVEKVMSGKYRLPSLYAVNKRTGKIHPHIEQAIKQIRILKLQEKLKALEAERDTGRGKNE